MRRRLHSGLVTALAAGALAAAVAGLAAPARAQDSLAHPAPVAHLSPAESQRFAAQIEADLTAKGAQVAVVFRTGRPRSELPKGIRYTHGAFWVAREYTEPDGSRTKGYSVYNLYVGDGVEWPADESRLVQDFPTDFTPGSAVDDVAVIIPTPALQVRIAALIDSPAYEGLHNPAYSLIANPWVARYQNCTTFMLSVISGAAWGLTDPAAITARLRRRYAPTIVSLGGLQRLIGPMLDPRVRMDDQSATLRTAAYESMAIFMRGEKMLKTTYTITFQR
jgi:hypothetical protein